MNASDSMIPQAETLIFALNLIVAVTLVCGAGLGAARLLRNHSAPLRYGLLTTALIFSLISPVVVLVVSHNGPSVLRWTLAAKQPDLTESQASGSKATVAMATGSDRQNGDEMSRAESPEANPATRISHSDPAANLDHESREAPVSAAPAVRGNPKEAGSSAPSARWWQIVGGFLLSVWGAGVAVSLVMLARGWVAVGRLRRSLHSPGDSRIERLANRIAESLGLHRSPPVYESALMPVPISLGLMHPAIILPEDIARELDDDQLESILLHETAHVVHRDHWIGLMARLTTALLWWHPLVHQIKRQLANLREDICDNVVVRQRGNGRSYARVLVELAARTTLRPAFPAAIGLLENEFDGLEGRVRRLLQDDINTETRLSLSATGVLATFVLLLAGVVFVSNVRAERAAPNDDEATAKPIVTLTVTVKSRNELIQAVRNAKPGAKILIAPGTYDGGLRFANLHGEKQKPIILAAADAKKPPVISGGSSGLHLTDPSYVEPHNLVITRSQANGLNIDDGGSYASPAHHVVLKGLLVRDIGSNRNHDGIKLSGVDDFRIENCTVERWGKTGSGIDMVGCHRGVVTGSTFREGDKIFGNAVQMKGGSRDITVSHCRFEDAGGRAINIGGSTGLEYFRPKPQGYEAKDITVSDCTFIGSMAPVAFVGVDGANVQNNTIYRPTRWVIRILQENQNAEFTACRNGRFANNIVVFRSDELAYPVNIGPGTSPKSFKFSENFWYCLNRPEKSQRAAQLPSKEKNGVYGRNPTFRDADEGDFRLKPGSPAKEFGPREKRPR
ncbi:MAG: M48 family metalloprotease [Planctomycetaceae bacterium]|nr:M48 family metalloprotease [Planctomycetaceae bacterium]